VQRFLDTIKAEVKSKKHNSTDPKVLEKKKVLCSSDYNATEFICVDFCKNDEKKQLVTLTSVTNSTDYTVIVWNHEK